MRARAQAHQPKKGGAEAWLDVHREAHGIGYALDRDDDVRPRRRRTRRSSSTSEIRELQDETERLHRVRAVVVQARQHAAGEEGPARRRAGERTCGCSRLARLYLDNFDHIQATWFSEGKKTGQIALHFGADDFGGTLFEENVHLATGT